MQKWVRSQLASMELAGVLRDPADSQIRQELERSSAAAGGRPMLDAASNDYLGLGSRAVSRETLQGLEGIRLGAGASRLVQGTFPEHGDLEEALARWTGMEASLLTSSAFAANIGAIPAIAGADALVISDALNHASIVDGCRLARAKVVVTPHLELAAVERALQDRVGAGQAWVVTEALFSMDGDRPDLVGLRALCDRYGAGLVVDEAHSLGVYGAQGGGAALESSIRPDLLIGGLGKAVGGQGGFCAVSEDLRSLLWNRARSFVFSTAPSPLLCRLLLTQVRQTQAADAARARLALRSSELREELFARDLPVLLGCQGPILPVLLGSNERALRVSRQLCAQGILAQAIRPPSVPEGGARLRLTAHADWPDGAPARIARALEQACGS